MKRQPWILAGTAIGLLMAAPLGASPLAGHTQRPTGDLRQPLPLILAQDEVQPEDVLPAPEPEPEEAPRRKPKREAAPEAEAEPEAAPAAEPEASPKRKSKRDTAAQEESETEEAPRRKSRREAAPEAEAEPDASPASEPEPEAAPKRKQRRQAEPAAETEGQAAPAAEPEQEAAPEPQPKPEPAPKRKSKRDPKPEPEAQEEPAPKPETAPKADAAPEPTPAPDQSDAPKAAEPDAPSKSEQPAETAPAAPAEPAAPEATPGQAAEPAQPSTDAPATGEQPAAPAESATPAQPAAPAEPATPAAPAEGAAAQPPVALPPGEEPAAGAAQTLPAGQAPVAVAPAAPAGPPPQDDAAAQVQTQPVQIQSVTAEKGTRRERGPDPDDDPRRRSHPEGVDVVREVGDRVIIQINNQVIVESDDRNRLNRGARDVYYEDLPRDRTRETVVREDGTQVVTVRNRYGDIVRRSRVAPDGEEYVLYYVNDDDYERVRDWRDPGLDLPPLQLTIPADEYILDAEEVDDEDAYYDFLDQPPVERVERLYSVDEVKRSSRIRQKTRRVDLDTVTFDFGSAAVPESQITKLEGVASAMEKLLKKNPAETFLIEGHTDAVGTDVANLALSDRRAEAVADALSNVFAIPPENLATQGYGEQYLKVKTESPEQQNRRVSIRRITALVAPAKTASAK